jgi:RNA polymerase sigma-70 factor (ECF subfamily)
MTMMTAALRPSVAMVAERRQPSAANDRDVSDEELIGRLADGDTEALEAIYDRYGHLVFSTAMRVVRDAQLAEDLSQDIFLRLWRQPEKYVAQKGRFVSWLLAVTRNLAVDRVRAWRRRLNHESASPDQEERELPAGEGYDPVRAAQLAEQRQVVREAMGCLSPQQRQVIELAYFGGFSQREVADRLGTPLGTVKTRVRAGMMRLRKALEARGEGWDRVPGLSG